MLNLIYKKLLANGGKFSSTVKYQNILNNKTIKDKSHLLYNVQAKVGNL